MKEFFQVTDIDHLLSLKTRFSRLGATTVGLDDAFGRVLSRDIIARQDLPGFDRSTMDGFAVMASSTFGASESNPAYLTVIGAVGMGCIPQGRVGPGQAMRIATGGMLPKGADSVVMVEHTDAVDDDTIELYHSVTPGHNVVARDEDAAAGQRLLARGVRLRAQDLGVLAACGYGRAPVHRRPRVGIISTGDEVVPVCAQPAIGQVRDINGHTLSALLRRDGARPCRYGIVKDRFDDLLAVCGRAVEENDMVLISGGSSVGARDLTLEALGRLPAADILAHGVSIRPGKPTILARCGEKAFWGLPGHVTSAMVVYMIVVRPFLAHISGEDQVAQTIVRARLSRNLASVQGRVDYVRVRLEEKDGVLWAEPVLGGSGLIRTMVASHGLVAIDLNSEGLEQGADVAVMLF